MIRANKYCYKFSLLLLCLVIITGCKSHKKNQKADFAVIDGVEVRFEKKENNKKNSIGEKIAKEAETWVGTPYKYAGKEKGKGTDCSGMVMKIYLDIAEVALPRNSAEQGEFCENLKENKVEAGDLVFFAIGKDSNKISHVGIMLDKIRFVHASSSKGVIISEMTTPYYKRNFKKYGRVPR